MRHAVVKARKSGSAIAPKMRGRSVPADDPLWAHPKILITPHKASDTTRSEVLRQLAEKYAALLADETPPGAVDRASGY